MAEQWYCSRGGRESGPFSAQQLREIVRKGHLSPDDQVRAGLTGAWIPAKRVRGLFPVPGQAVHDSGILAPAHAAYPIPPPPPPPQAAPPRVAPPVAPAGPPPVGAQFEFLEEPPSPHHVGHDGGLFEEARRQDDKRRRQFLVVWVLLATFVVLAALVVVVYVWVNQPYSAPEQNASRAPVERPKVGQASVPGVAEKGPQAPGAKPPAPQAKAASPAPDAGSKRTAAEPDEGKWLAAKDATATVGDVHIRIRSAVIGRPKEFVVPSRASKSQRFLILTLELSNSSKSRKIDHGGWSGRAPSGAGVRLADEIPNKYALKAGLIGQAGPEPIYPGQSIEDKLFFERPIDSAKVLRLQLPALAFGGKGMVKFEIPREMIVDAPEEPEPAETPAAKKDAPKAEATTSPKTAAAKSGAKTDDQPERTGDPKVDFGIRDDDKAMSRPPPPKRNVFDDEPAKADQDRPAKKSDKAAQGGPKEKSADGKGGNQPSGFNKANNEKSPF